MWGKVTTVITSCYNYQQVQLQGISSIPPISQYGPGHRYCQESPSSSSPFSFLSYFLSSFISP